ncbi:hypothetical protein GCM10027293_37650 [Pontibacter aydingkolensis]
MPTNVFQRVEVDGKGHVWVGTNGLGLVKFSPEDSSWTRAITNHQVRAISKDSNGDIWVGSGSGGIQATGGGIRKFIQGDLSSFTYWGATTGALNRYVNGLAEGHNNTIWAAHGQTITSAYPNDKIDEGGIGWYDGNVWNKITQAGMPASDRRVLSVAKVGENMWVGVDRSCINGTCTAPYIAEYTAAGTFIRKVSDGLPFVNAVGGPLPRSIYHDSKGRTWVGLSSGDGVVAVYENNNWTVMNNSITKLPLGTAVGFQSIREDESGYIWIGTSNGLLKLSGNVYQDSSNWSLYTTDNKLPSNFINGITFNGVDMWLATSAGITKVNLNLQLKGKVTDVRANTFTGTNSYPLLSGSTDVHLELDGVLLPNGIVRIGDDGSFEFDPLLVGLQPDKKYKLTVKHDITKMSVILHNVPPYESDLQIRVPFGLKKQIDSRADSLVGRTIRVPIVIPFLGNQEKYSVSGISYNTAALDAQLDKWKIIDRDHDKAVESMNRLYLTVDALERFFEIGEPLPGKALNVIGEGVWMFFEAIRPMTKVKQDMEMEVEILREMIPRAPAHRKKILEDKLQSYYEKLDITNRLLKISVKMFNEIVLTPALEKIPDEDGYRMVKAAIKQAVERLQLFTIEKKAVTGKDFYDVFKTLAVMSVAPVATQDYYIDYQTQSLLDESVANAASNTYSGTFKEAAVKVNMNIQNSEKDVLDALVLGETLEETSALSSTASEVASIGANILLISGVGASLAPLFKGTAKALDVLSTASLAGSIFTYTYNFLTLPSDAKAGIGHAYYPQRSNLLENNRIDVDLTELLIATKRYNDSLVVLKLALSENDTSKVSARAASIQSVEEELDKSVKKVKNQLYSVAPLTLSSPDFEAAYSNIINISGKAALKRMSVYYMFMSYLLDPENIAYKQDLQNEIDALIASNNSVVTSLEQAFSIPISVSPNPYLAVTDVTYPDTIYYGKSFDVTLKYKNYGANTSSAFDAVITASQDLIANSDSLHVAGVKGNEEGQITFTLTAERATDNPYAVFAFKGVNTVSEAIAFQLSSTLICNLPDKPLITQQENQLTSNSPTGNQWYLNGTAIEGATSQSYTATISGIYTVQVSGSCGLSEMSEAATYTLTSVEDELSQAIEVYPNPASEALFVDLPNDIILESVAIYNAQGKVLIMINGDNKNKVKVNVSAYAKGLHILQIQTDKGVIYKKVVLR